MLGAPEPRAPDPYKEGLWSTFIACLADLRDLHAAVRVAHGEQTLTAAEAYTLLAEAIDRLVVPALAILS